MLLSLVFRLSLLTCVYYVICYICNVFSLGSKLESYLHEDVRLPPVTYAKKYGYSAESHFVQTADDVVLEVHRIFDKKHSNSLKSPVILQHGLFLASDSWLVNTPNNSLAFKLADQGYDVWLTNIRGNRFGLRSSSKPFFWSHTKDHLSLLDAPATIDYILKITKKTHLHFIGHSQGSFMLLALLSEKPEYNEKIRLGIALAPVTILSNVTSNVRRRHIVTDKLSFLMPKELGNPSRFPVNIIANPLMCKLSETVCSRILAYFTGFHPTQVDPSRLQVWMSVMPAGTSFEVFEHYTQTLQTGRFAKFSYGAAENFQRYGSPSSPLYDLSRINTNLAVYYAEGDGDIYAGRHHNKWLLSSLPSAKIVDQASFQRMGHIDFQTGIRADLLHNRIMKVIGRYD